MITRTAGACRSLVELVDLRSDALISSLRSAIMPIGLVTKNGIPVVEFANQKRASGLPLREAVLETAPHRLRPILMTSLATAPVLCRLRSAWRAAATSRIPLRDCHRRRPAVLACTDPLRNSVAFYSRHHRQAA